MRDFTLILHKELIDIFRDKRSFIMIFVPVLLFPLMFMLMTSQLGQSELQKDIPCIVEYTPGSSDETLYHALFDGTGLVRETAVRKSAEEDLRDGAVYAVLTVRDGTLTLMYNDASTKSVTAYGVLAAHLETVRQTAAEETMLKRYGATLGSLQLFTLNTVTLPGGSGSSFMASVAPMLLVVMIMSGGVSVAVDVFTGEKERGTFESLMTTQASRTSILMAKFAATLLLNVLCMLLSIAAYVISVKCSGSALEMITGSSETGVTFSRFCMLLAVCLTLSVFAMSLMTVIGLHAKSVKDAQSQPSLLTLLPSLLSGLTMFMESASIRTPSMLIPVFNAIVSIKMIFLGTAKPIHILCTTLSCILYSVVMWALSVRILRSEKLLAG